MGRYCDSATVRALIGMHAEALDATANLLVRDTARTLTQALEHGDALSVALRLMRHAPIGLGVLDSELYAAAISLASALWHVETGEDAGAAIGAAIGHLHAAPDAYTPPAGVRP